MSTDLMQKIINAGKEAQAKGRERYELLKKTFDQVVQVIDELLGEDYQVLSPTAKPNQLFDDKNMLSRSHPDFANQISRKLHHVHWYKGDEHKQRVSLAILPTGQGTKFVAIWLGAELTNDGIRLSFGSEKNTTEIRDHAWDPATPETGKAAREQVKGVILKGLNSLVSDLKALDNVAWYCFRNFMPHNSITLTDESPETKAPSNLIMQSVVWRDKD